MSKVATQEKPTDVWEDYIATDPANYKIAGTPHIHVQGQTKPLDIYVYDHTKPLDLNTLQEAMTQILESSVKYSLLDRYLMSYIDKIRRVSPWYDGIEGEAAANLVEVWNTRLASHWKTESEKDEALRQKLAKMTPDARARHFRSVGSIPRADPARQKTEEPETETVVDDAEKGYSSWMLYETRLQQLMAAARYIETFPYLQKRLGDEPMLAPLRLDALGYLAEGGKVKERVATIFLTAWKKQASSEAQTAVPGKPKAEDPLVSYEMSDGEDFVDEEGDVL